jgi:uncharacterized protein (DUF608 family)
VVGKKFKKDVSFLNKMKSYVKMMIEYEWTSDSSTDAIPERSCPTKSGWLRICGMFYNYDC